MSSDEVFARLVFAGILLTFARVIWAMRSLPQDQNSRERRLPVMKVKSNITLTVIGLVLIIAGVILMGTGVYQTDHNIPNSTLQLGTWIAGSGLVATIVFCPKPSKK